MYSDFTVNLFLSLLRLGNWLGSIPFRLNKAKGEIYIHFWSHFRTLHFWLWATSYAFIILPTHLYSLHQNGEAQKINYTLMITIASLSCTVMGKTVVFNTQSVCQLLNGLWKYLPDFKKKYIYLDGRDKQKIRPGVETVLCFVISLFLLVTISSGFDTLIRPQSPAYLLYGIETRLLSWPIILIASWIFSSNAVAFSCVTGMLMFNGILYFAYFLPIIRYELRMGLQTYKTRQILRSDLSQFTVCWRSIQLLAKIMNTEIFFVILYVRYAITLATIIATVSLTYQWDITGMFIRLLMFGVIFIGTISFPLFLSIIGSHFKCTEDTIFSWKRKYWPKSSEWRYMEKFKESCSPFSLGDGNGQCITPISVPRYLHSLSDNCLTVMITYADIMGYK